VLQTAMTWTPSFLNGGHECLVAMAYNQQATGLPVASLNGDAPNTDTYSIAQHNLGVLRGTQIGPRIHYAFQVCNGADAEREFVVAAQQAPLSEIAEFLHGVPGGRTVIAASDHPDAAELAAAPAVLRSAKIAGRSCRPFSLTGTLRTGNA
jgi:hypothetical protein